jgi:hypothetical protein
MTTKQGSRRDPTKYPYTGRVTVSGLGIRYGQYPGGPYPSGGGQRDRMAADPRTSQLVWVQGPDGKMVQTATSLLPRR